MTSVAVWLLTHTHARTHTHTHTHTQTHNSPRLTYTTLPCLCWLIKQQDYISYSQNIFLFQEGNIRVISDLLLAGGPPNRPLFVFGVTVDNIPSLSHTFHRHHLHLRMDHGCFGNAPPPPPPPPPACVWPSLPVPGVLSID